MTGLRNVVRNASLNLVGHAVPLAIGAATIPFTIRWLGPDRFGVLSLVWVVIGYIGVFDFGLGRATTRFVAESLGNERRDARTLIWTAVATQGVLGILGAILLVILVGAVVDHVLSVPASLLSETNGAFRLLALAVPFALVSTSLRGALEAAQAFGSVNAVRGTVTSLYFLTPMLGASVGWALPQIVLCIVLLYVVGTVAYSALCLRVFPGIRSPRVELRTLRRLMAFGSWVAVSGFVGPFLVYLDRFVIAVVLSVAAAGQYAGPYELLTRLWIIPMSLAAALFPVFSAERRLGRVDVLAVRSLGLLSVTMGPAMFATVVLADEITRVVLGRNLGIAMALPLRILAVGLFVNSLAFVPYALLQASGRPDVTGKLHLAELPLHIFLVLLLVQRLGLVGAALAWSIRVTIDAALLFVAAGRLEALTVHTMKARGVAVLILAIVGLGAGAFALSAIPSLPVRVGALVAALCVAAAWLFERQRPRLGSLTASASRS
jgi:O-antigen/teichoic acid export membrane protein